MNENWALVALIAAGLIYRLTRAALDYRAKQNAANRTAAKENAK